MSRKQLLEDLDEGSDENADEQSGEGGSEEDVSNDEGDEDSEDQSEAVRGSHDHIFVRRLPSASEESDDSSEVEGEKPSTVEPSDQVPPVQVHSNDVTSTLQETRENDIKKGQAVKRQIVRVLCCPRRTLSYLQTTQALWDTLLDTRIRLQKSVVSANTLPSASFKFTVRILPSLNRFTAIADERVSRDIQLSGCHFGILERGRYVDR